MAKRQGYDAWTATPLLRLGVASPGRTSLKNRAIATECRFALLTTVILSADW